MFATIQEFPALSICYTYSDPYRCTKFGNHCYKILMIDTILRGFKNDWKDWATSFSKKDNQMFYM